MIDLGKAWCVMLQVPEPTARLFEDAMAATRVGLPERNSYRKWLRYYLDFCGKYGRPPAEESSLGPFLDKLASKNQSADQRRQAEQAVRLYLALPGGPRPVANRDGGARRQAPPAGPRVPGPPTPPNAGDTTRDARPEATRPAAPDRQAPRGDREGPPASLSHHADTVHDGKGQKDRTVPLPMSLVPRIRNQFARVAALLREDLSKDFAGAFLPRHLEKKYPNAGREFIWQWFFPAARLAGRADRLRRRRIYRRQHGPARLEATPRGCESRSH